MKVCELAVILAAMPQDKEILVFWDSAARGEVEGIINSQEAVVIVGEWRDGKFNEDEIVYQAPECV